MTMDKTLSQQPLQKASKPLKNGTLTPQQKAVLEECPSAYRPTMKRAFSGSSKTAAIKAMCLTCTGWLRAEIRNCSAQGCPIHPYRPYQSGGDQDD